MEDAAFLEALAKKLKVVRARHLATQSEIERRTGVHQETISKVINGKRRRVSPALRVLNDYADMLITTSSLPPVVTEAAREFLAFGTEAELVDSIRHCTRLVTHRLR